MDAYSWRRRGMTGLAKRGPVTKRSFQTYRLALHAGPCVVLRFMGEPFLGYYDVACMGGMWLPSWQIELLLSCQRNA